MTFLIQDNQDQSIIVRVNTVIEPETAAVTLSDSTQDLTNHSPPLLPARVLGR